ncbi:MAG: FAD-dependent oxidoreductase [Anaerolineae bacterium]|nr:FAD-dependent oxidoreductase [Anaerolineae bacterium]
MGDAGPTVDGQLCEIADRSGIAFHHPVGLLRISSSEPDALVSLRQAEDVGRALHAPLERLGATELAERFPLIKFSPQAQALHETGDAGFIVPRALVAAQTKIAAAQGAQLVREEVSDIARDRQRGVFEITTQSGQQILAARVVFSVHGYTNFILRQVLGRALDLASLPHTTVYAELDATQAQRFADVPVLIWQLAGHPVLPSIYSTPPMRFPNGRSYLKIGGPLHRYSALRTPDEMLTWFHSAGDPIEIEALQSVLVEVMDGLQVARWASKPCMNTYTPHDHPYIAQLDEGLFVCTGGCGSAAKSSDEIGRMGAMLALEGKWTGDLSSEDFAAVYASDSPCYGVP